MRESNILLKLGGQVAKGQQIGRNATETLYEAGVIPSVTGQTSAETSHAWLSIFQPLLPLILQTTLPTDACWSQFLVWQTQTWFPGDLKSWERRNYRAFRLCASHLSVLQAIRAEGLIIHSPRRGLSSEEQTWEQVNQKQVLLNKAIVSLMIITDFFWQEWNEGP